MAIVDVALFVSCLVFAPATGTGEPGPSARRKGGERAAPTLPLRKLRLYETGVGYFERHGAVDPKKSLALPLPAAHLDDALKSLVVLEATGDLRVEAIAFPTAVSEGLARAMAGLPDASDTPVSYADLLHGLEGAAVEVTTRGKRIAGRLVDVEGPFVPKPAPKADGEEPEVREPFYTLLVLGDDDAVRRISTRDVEGVRALDRTTAARLGVAAEALADQTARRVQSLSVHASARGQLGLGYIAENPVWRTTYRVVLPEADKSGRLQAWALVHNDTDEDWRDVRIELVNGRPASFLHPLASPRYARRELVPPNDELSTIPQLANKTVDRMWLDHDVSGSLTGEEIGEAYGAGGLGLAGTGRGGGGTGEGTIGLGHTGTIGYGIGYGEGFGDLAELAKAQGVESGALFIYRVTDAVDLDAHHSALLPIVQQDIEVESIAWFDVGASDGLSAVRLVNSTSQTLPAGAVSFFADGGFVGESALDRLKPEERRFIAYGAELDVELYRNEEKLGETTRAVVYRDGDLARQYVAKRKIVLEVRNRSRRAQKIYVALDVAREAKLDGDAGVELDFDLATGRPLAATRVEPGAAAKHTLVTQEPKVELIEKIDVAVLERLAASEGLPGPMRDRLRAALQRARAAAELDRTARRHDRELSTARADLDRLRADLEALGAAGARQRAKTKLARRLVDAETRIDDARTEAASARTEARRQRARMRAELDAIPPPA